MSELNTPLSLSLLRKTNKRLSVAGATRASLLASTSSRSTGLFDPLGSGSKRRSLLLTPALNKRRNSSTYQPPSSQPSSQVNSQQPHSQTQSVTRHDSRPLRDRNYQVLIQQEIHDFLSANKFELEMNHPLTAKTLRQPTQKDFVLIFQFLYGKIDPNYRFTKSVETEVFVLLKVLNYPYLDGINRSQISAVGGHNWPAFLGMIYWLVKVSVSLLSFTEDEFISPEDDVDRIFIDFAMKAYTSFIDGNEDYSAFVAEAQERVKATDEELDKQLAELAELNTSLLADFAKLRGEMRNLEDSEKKSKALESDLVKFKAYIETMESRKVKWNEVIGKIEDELKSSELELKELEKAKKELERTISDKGFSIKDIDGLNLERDKVSKATDITNNKIEELRNQLQSKNIDLSKNYQSLQNFVKQYNNTIYKMQSPKYNFELKLNDSIINEGRAFSPREILDKALKEEKIELLKYRTEINSQVHQNQDECIKLQEQSDLIRESILDQLELVENLEAKLVADKSTHEELYETMLNDGAKYTTQIERLQRELTNIKINTNQGFIEVENKFQNKSIEYDELNHDLFKEKSILHDKIQRIIEFTINFKVSIQLNLEDLDFLAMSELDGDTQVPAGERPA